MGKQGGPGDVEDDWKCWSDAKCNKTSGGQGGKDGATISTYHNSNQVGMTLLANCHIHDFFTLFNSGPPGHLHTSAPPNLVVSISIQYTISFSLSPFCSCNSVLTSVPFTS